MYAVAREIYFFIMHRQLFVSPTFAILIETLKDFVIQINSKSISGSDVSMNYDFRFLFILSF